MNKSTRTLLIFWFLVVSSLYAGEITYTANFMESDLSFHKCGKYDIVSLKNCEFGEKIGEPMLPEHIIRIIIPSSAEVTHIRVEHTEKDTLLGEYYIFPAQPMRPISYKVDIPFASPNDSIYGDSIPYPSKVINLAHVGKMAGYKIVSILIYPLQYLPRNKKLIFYSTIRFTLEYKDTHKEAEILSQKQKRIFSEIIKKMVVNPESVDRFGPQVRVGSKGSEYIIITSPSFASYFQPLADWKIQKGIPAEVVTTNWIYSNYSGRDNPEKIRNFINDAYSNGAIWILLGGQCDYENNQEIVPRRDVYFWTSDVGYYTDEDTIPCDLYYADIDGTWDADNDNVFGEKEDNVDMYADIFVSRAPVRTISQVQNFVDKVIHYEKNPSDALRRDMLPAVQLFPDWWGDVVNNHIADITPAPWEDKKLYESDGTLSRQKVIDCINNGIGLAHYAAHGNEYGIYYANGNTILNSNDAENLTNGYKLGVHISIACFAGAVDEVPGGDCFAEHLINNPNGGAIAVAMNSRYG